MKLLHSSIFKIIIVCLLFIILLMGVGELTPVKWGFNERQIIMDIVIVLIAIGC
jgi:NADH:ubiquinone oxidoreductase 49 kD subunit 7